VWNKVVEIFSWKRNVVLVDVTISQKSLSNAFSDVP
jgi:hypothetical protein